MKVKILLSALLTILLASASEAQSILPDSYTATHSDSCWNITINYFVDDIPSNKQVILTSSIICPDSCIHSEPRYFRGKRFRQKDSYFTPTLSQSGMQHCKVSIPEILVNDSMLVVTSYTVEDKNERYDESDSMYIFLPGISPLSCHPVSDIESCADRIAYEHHYIYPMRHYEPLETNNIPSYFQSGYIVNYRPTSHILENSYMQNNCIIDTLASLISNIVADSLAQIEVIQLVGYSSPDHKERRSKALGMHRARSLRDKLKYLCLLHDSVFEIADGGHNWEVIYESIGNSNDATGDSLLTILRSEAVPSQREALLYNLLNSNRLKMPDNNALMAQRQACCARIYYRNRPDSVATELNKVVYELMRNDTPNYDSLRTELLKYRNDARALNLMGIIDYREHRRGAAKKAFSTAALMGDEQAMTNLLIITRDK